jgi:peptidoglycan/LPS O-acetylase OafA/YrhL
MESKSTRLIRSLRTELSRKTSTFRQSVTNSLSDGKQKNPIFALDGVRAIACLSVVSFHLNLFAYVGHVWGSYTDDFGASFSSLALLGESGVLLFFVLSGFLLFLPFANAMLFDQPWPSLRRYYIRRVFRILPAYYFALFLMTLYLQPSYLQPEHLHELWLFFTFRMDFPVTYQQLNAPFWTLAVEFQFYLLLPLIAWVMSKIVRGGSLPLRLGKLTLCLMAMMGWGLYSRYWGFLLTNNPIPDPNALVPQNITDTIKPYIFGTSGKYFEIFSIGMIVAMLYLSLHKAQETSVLRRRLMQASPFIFALGLLCLWATTIWHFYVIYVYGLTLHYLDPYEAFLFHYKDVMIPWLYGLCYGLCVFAVLHGPKALKRPFEWAPLRWIGFISYSLYLWHDPFVIYFSTSLLPRFQMLGWSQVMQYLAYVLWVLVTTIPLSFALYRWLEMPAIRFGELLCQLVASTPRGTKIVPQIQEKVLVAAGKGPISLQEQETTDRPRTGSGSSSA